MDRSFRNQLYRNFKLYYLRPLGGFYGDMRFNNGGYLRYPFWKASTSLFPLMLDRFLSLPFLWNMNRKCHFRVSYAPLLFFVISVSVAEVARSESDVNPEIEMGRKYPKRVYTISRIQPDQQSPVIDGKVDEDCWKLGKWDGGFLQREPDEGKEPTDPTEIKLLYDNDAIYVAIRSFVKDVSRRDKQITRRDHFAGDMVGIAFDSFYDKRTAFEFDVTGGGSKVDILIHADGFDMNWNAVWDVAVGEEKDAWISEFRIPFSQLRFPKDVKDRVWGLHSWRWHRDSSSESNWQVIPRDNSGFVYQFGELRGLENLKPKRQIEILPYLSGSYTDLQKEEGNPFRQGGEQNFETGLDAKIGLTSNIIMDLTINPDFGQVEADPSELNLSTMETFFEEQRPFFLEGKSLFEYDVKGDLLFYSRRIGRHPSHEPDTDGFVNIPSGTRILGAAKLTGKTQNGLSIGGLYAMAAREDATIYENGEYRTETAEAQSQFLVARIRQELNEGGTAIGGILTGTLRDPDDAVETQQADTALTAGLDFNHRFLNRTHYVNAALIGSQVSGSESAISELQQNWLHNFQRPDAEHVEYNPTLDEIAGWGGNIALGKDNGGHWRYHTELDWRSPELELNDVGFVDVIDRIRQDNVIRYVVEEPGEWFKSYQLRFTQVNHYVYDGTFVKNEFDFSGSFQMNNNWHFGQRFGYDSELLDTRGLRGGPAMKKPGFWTASFDMSSDGSKDFMWWTSFYVDHSLEGNSGYKGFWPGFQIKRGSRLRFNFNVGYSEADYKTQWVGQQDYEDGRESSYFLGRMKRDTFQSTIRFDYNFTPEISLTYYGNLYLTSGNYEDYKLVTDPLAGKLENRYYQFGDSEWTRDGDSGLMLNHSGQAFYVDDPDFNYRSFHSNLVFRWEYKPGSTFYVVWSQQREDSDLNRESALNDDFSRILDARGNNTFLIKASYWFSI